MINVERPPPVCSLCGVGKLIRTDVKGREVFYRGKLVRPRRTAMIRVCNHCGEFGMSDRESVLFDEVVQEAYRVQLAAQTYTIGSDVHGMVLGYATHRRDSHIRTQTHGSVTVLAQVNGLVVLSSERSLL